MSRGIASSAQPDGGAVNFAVKRGSSVNPIVAAGHTLDNAGGTVVGGVNNGTIQGGSFGGTIQKNGTISGDLMLLDGGRIVWDQRDGLVLMH